MLRRSQQVLMAWMQLSDDEFAARVESQVPGELSGFQATTPRHAYPLTHVRRSHADRRCVRR
jgi:hypothetical protein